ncbi:MAG: glutamate--tRNA ligase [Chloroflexi bacterium]|nr:glutamate--tRNA ligase [Chloroflexota bacterium]
MPEQVRVRYAPSPTGIPHVGNIRTALFNWLFARHHGGRFIVRIEDTDQSRRMDGATEAILESLRWLELDWDEGPEVGGEFGPYFQSERLDIYHQYAEKLLGQGDAYHCYCSPARLDEMRKEQARKKQPPKYDKRCRDLSEEDARAGGDTDVPVVRFRIPPDIRVSFNDQVRGEVSFESNVLDDFVIVKADGFPTYHLANVVDDHLMEISHVLRAEEWLSSTPRHVLLYDALDLKPPHFVHLPMILGPDRSKLSKRHGATSLLEYRDQGFLPQAMLNYLALMGWALDDRTELFSREDLVRHFTVERVGKTGAIFDVDKLTWMNGVYIREMSSEEFIQWVLPFMEKDLSPHIPRPLDREYVGRVLPLLQERTKSLKELGDRSSITGDGPLADFFFQEELEYDPQVIANNSTTDFAHPVLGDVKMCNFPVIFSETPAGVWKEAPELGQDTESILIDELGYDWADIQRFQEAGSIL